MIHPSAIVEPGAQLGADCEIHAHAIIRKHAILGDRVVVHPFAVIGGDPQYLKFDRSTESFARVGSGTVLREYVTINRAIHAGQATTVGENCFLMSGAHLAHDCAVGNNVVLANNALLAGHVSVGDFAFIGGGAAAHQFTRIGESVMLGGLARITRDLAPYTIVAERDEVSGLNLIGLKRRGFSRDAIKELKEAFRAVYSDSGNIRELAKRALEGGTFTTAEARKFLEFFTSGKRSFARPVRAARSEDAETEA
ncbi:MAG: acyl-ACP--UDP-N-acetylglucosamine O-acyltransferase [Nibricoccus sp.]